jgi:hypothetical protein
MSSSTTFKVLKTPASTSDSGREPRSLTSPIWHAAIEKYYAELSKGGIKTSVIDKDLWNIRSPDDLLSQIEALVPAQAIESKTWTKVLHQLQPILLGLNDFTALIAWTLGMNGRVAAVIWGSIRLIIKVSVLLTQRFYRCRTRMLNVKSLPSLSFQTSLICLGTYSGHYPVYTSTSKSCQ